MTTPFWCLFIVAVIPYLLAGTAGYFKLKQLGELDNKHPRAQATQLEGAGARAYAAQMNSWEALAVFGAAVFVNHLKGGDPGTAALLAQGFVATRVLHPIFYIANMDKLRSGIFVVGFLLSFGLFVI